MERVTNVTVSYEPSDRITKQGKRSDIEKYLRQGYKIQQDRNGFWVLVKPLKLFVTLTNMYGTNTFSVKDKVLEHYNRLRISEGLINTFENDIRNGKIAFEMNKECSSYIMK